MLEKEKKRLRGQLAQQAARLTELEDGKLAESLLASCGALARSAASLDCSSLPEHERLLVLAGALGLDTTVSNPNAADGFGDASQIGSYAKTAVSWAVERGIMGGHNNLLTPKSSATRVQLAQMLYSFDTVYAD